MSGFQAGGVGMENGCGRGRPPNRKLAVLPLFWSVSVGSGGHCMLREVVESHYPLSIV